MRSIFEVWYNEIARIIRPTNVPIEAIVSLQLLNPSPILPYILFSALMVLHG